MRRTTSMKNTNIGHKSSKKGHSGKGIFPRRRTLLLFAICALACGAAAFPRQQNSAPANRQATTQQPAIKSTVKMVSVLATVRDKHGKIVANLTKDNFTLTEDGRPQTISYFSAETDLPLTMGLLVDTSWSQRNVLGQERDASNAFLNQTLREDKDKAFLIHFDREVELLQDLTSSRQKLAQAIGLLNVPEFNNASAQSSPPDDDGRGNDSHARHGGGTLLYDAVYLASNEITAKQQGRKALIVLSDGVDRGSKVSLSDAIESAQHADTLVYSILIADHEGEHYGGHHGGFGGPGMGRGGGGWPGQGGPGGGNRRPREERPDGKKILEQISRETGGRMFEVSKKETVDQIYAQIGEELRNQYLLGYAPAPTDEGPGYRKIVVTTNQKDLAVQARDGYYAGQ